MTDWLEIQFWEVAKWLIKRGYGADCETKDTEDFPGLHEAPEARCASCEAREVIEWIDGHIALLAPNGK